MKILHSLHALFTIVMFRYRPLARVWAMLLILVNVGSLFFLDTIYGQVALAAVAVGIVIMVAIQMKRGFVRLLGVGHILWFAMLPWMFSQLPTVDGDSNLYRWLIALIAFNSVSLVIDTVDVVRYCRGERQPHYSLDDLHPGSP